MSVFEFKQIGVIRSPYKEKFAVPRQPGLVPEGTGELHLLPPFNQIDAVRGLDGFSHIWVVFVFHRTMDAGWHPTVRPPRLGGNSRIGVFATRSTFRPNPVGMSLIALNGIRHESESLVLELGSMDLVDGTPVIDIKPYLPYAESVPDALAGFAQLAPEAAMPVVFSPLAERQLSTLASDYPRLRRFIEHLLAQDPRPAYRRQQQGERVYAVRLLEFNLRWHIIDDQAEVLSVDPTDHEPSAADKTNLIR